MTHSAFNKRGRGSAGSVAAPLGLVSVPDHLQQTETQTQTQTAMLREVAHRLSTELSTSGASLGTKQPLNKRLRVETETTHTASECSTRAPSSMPSPENASSAAFSAALSTPLSPPSPSQSQLSTAASSPRLGDWNGSATPTGARNGASCLEEKSFAQYRNQRRSVVHLNNLPWVATANDLVQYLCRGGASPTSSCSFQPLDVKSSHVTQIKDAAGRPTGRAFVAVLDTQLVACLQQIGSGLATMTLAHTTAASLQALGGNEFSSGRLDGHAKPLEVRNATAAEFDAYLREQVREAARATELVNQSSRENSPRSNKGGAGVSLGFFPSQSKTDSPTTAGSAGAAAAGVAPDSPQTESADTIPLGAFVLKIRGLPFTARVPEIAGLFHAYGVGPEHLTLGVHRHGPRRGAANGEAFVRFGTQEQADAALRNMQGCLLGRRYLELFPSSLRELTSAVDARNIGWAGAAEDDTLPLEARSKTFSGVKHIVESVVKMRTIDAASNGFALDGQSTAHMNGPGGWLKVRGLPYAAGPQEVADFLNSGMATAATRGPGNPNGSSSVSVAAQQLFGHAVRFAIDPHQPGKHSV